MAINTPTDLNSDNPLHSYRTYSYHHVLIACVDSTIAESAFTSIPFNQLLPTPASIGNIAQRCTPRYVDGDLNQPYIVMINTQVDSEFLIKNITVNAIPSPPLNPIPGTEDYEYARSAFAYDGTMVIDEPFGIRFGDMLAQVSKNLNASPERVVFILKTGFFGFTDTGASTIQQIKPIAIAFMDIDATFTAAGGHYEMKFVTYANGFANRKEVANVGGVAKFQVVDGTIGTAMQKLCDVLNAEQDHINQQNPKLTPIKYKIVPHAPFDGYIITNANVPNLNKNEIQFNASMNDSMTTIIEKIMLLSKQVREDWAKSAQTPTNSESNPKTDRSIFKIYSEVINKRNQLEVTYHIIPHKIKVVPTPTEEDKKADSTILKQKRKDAINQFIAEASAKNNFISYNYIYSGKNVDIIDFEMKINLWTTYRMYYMEDTNFAAKSQIKGDYSAGTNVVGTEDIYNQDTPDLSHKMQFVPGIPNQVPYNVKDAQEYYKFDDYLSRAVSFAAGGTYVSLTIAGDPRLYAGFFQSPLDKDGKVADPSTLVGDANIIMSNWAQIPALVQINIFMPNPPDAIIQDQTVDQSFASAFWFDGLYLIVGITSMFDESGKFTQKLELLPIPGDYNIPDLSEFGQSNTTAAVGNPTSEQAVAASTPAPPQTVTKPIISLTAKQKQCMATAYNVAYANGMPPETLEAILLVDSNACLNSASAVNSQSDLVFGPTTLSVSRVQNYLRGNPGVLAPYSKRYGIPYTPESADSIRYLLTKNEQFNLDMTAKIWLEDRTVVQNIFNTSGGGGRGTQATLKPDLTAQANIAHHNIYTKNSKTKFQDVGFQLALDAPDPTQNAYQKSILAQTDTIMQFNSIDLPPIQSDIANKARRQ
jgi:hypothetical protein